jgi:hypothetical protein
MVCSLSADSTADAGGKIHNSFEARKPCFSQGHAENKLPRSSLTSQPWLNTARRRRAPPPPAKQRANLQAAQMAVR